MSDKPLYLTTTLPYVNSDPHIGFGLEIVQADAYARFARLMGRPVFFNTGTDEHGQKIFEAAKKAGQDVQAYVDHYAAQFKELGETLNLSNDAFIRTTDPKHVAAAQDLWRRCERAGDIYKKKYAGLYCVGDEAFLKESDLVDGRCPNHPTMEPVMLEEENYFFKLSAYQDKLEAYLAREGSAVPEWRRQDALAFVRAGLEDFSISREAARLSWGIPVPGDDSQVMYVWFDALTNYVSTLGWPDGDAFKKFWDGGEVVQVAGKDQVRFQSIIWQAMLMSAGVKNTDRVYYHGFITSGGQKMSKSLGNVIAPKELVERYGVDATRYLLLSHVQPFEDSDLTLQKLDEWYEADLANGLGNLASRIMQLAQTHAAEPQFAPEPWPDEYVAALERYEMHRAAEYVWREIARVDQELTHKAPFKLVKTDAAAGKKMIGEFVVELARINRLLQPLMPDTAAKIAAAIQSNTKPENLFPRKA